MKKDILAQRTRVVASGYRTSAAARLVPKVIAGAMTSREFGWITAAAQSLRWVARTGIETEMTDWAMTTMAEIGIAATGRLESLPVIPMMRSGITVRLTLATACTCRINAAAHLVRKVIAGAMTSKESGWITGAARNSRSGGAAVIETEMTGTAITTIAGMGTAVTGKLKSSPAIPMMRSGITAQPIRAGACNYRTSAAVHRAPRVIAGALTNRAFGWITVAALVLHSAADGAITGTVDTGIVAMVKPRSLPAIPTMRSGITAQQILAAACGYRGNAAGQRVSKVPPGVTTTKASG